MKTWKFIRNPESNAALIKELQQQISSYDKAMSCLGEDDSVKCTIRKKCTELMGQLAAITVSSPESSNSLLDALNVATGSYLQCIKNDVVIWEMDATELLREFARWCALEVVNKYLPSEKPYRESNKGKGGRKYIPEFLKTGENDRGIRTYINAYYQPCLDAIHFANNWDGGSCGSGVIHGASRDQIAERSACEASFAALDAHNASPMADLHLYAKESALCARHVLRLMELDNEHYHFNYARKYRQATKKEQNSKLTKLVKLHRKF